jgi:hypothetical protein
MEGARTPARLILIAGSSAPRPCRVVVLPCARQRAAGRAATGAAHLRGGDFDGAVLDDLRDLPGRVRGPPLPSAAARRTLRCPGAAARTHETSWPSSSLSAMMLMKPHGARAQAPL